MDLLSLETLTQEQLEKEEEETVWKPSRRKPVHHHAKLTPLNLLRFNRAPDLDRATGCLQNEVHRFSMSTATSEGLKFAKALWEIQRHAITRAQSSAFCSTSEHTDPKAECGWASKYNFDPNGTMLHRTACRDIKAAQGCLGAATTRLTAVIPHRMRFRGCSL